MDNVGVFDRSQDLPTGGHLDQADGSAWMAFYCTIMLDIALELAKFDPAYEDVASKFFEHFVAIADAMNSIHGVGMWDEDAGFYHDQLRIGDRIIPLRVRSMVGLVPLFAVLVVDAEATEGLPGFTKRMKWFLENRKDLRDQISYMEPFGACVRGRRLLAIPSKARLELVLKKLFDESEFLSPYGIRSLSKIHDQKPFEFPIDGTVHRVRYVPGEDDSGMFGGNSNWRGPIWFPMNYMIVESLQRYHYFFGDDFKVEYPTGSGKMLNLKEAADDLSGRLTRLFLPKEGVVPSQGVPANEPLWNENLWFHVILPRRHGSRLGGVAPNRLDRFGGEIPGVKLSYVQFLLNGKDDDPTCHDRCGNRRLFPRGVPTPAPLGGGRFRCPNPSADGGGYTMAFVEAEGKPACVAGFRFLDTLPWGKVLYVDDLITDANSPLVGSRKGDVGLVEGTGPWTALRPIAPGFRGSTLRRASVLSAGADENQRASFFNRALTLFNN